MTTFGPDDPCEVVVARGYGPPAFTLTQAARLVRAGGPIVISEPPGVDRWDEQLLAELGLRRVEAPTVASSAAGTRDLDGLVAVFLSR